MKNLLSLIMVLIAGLGSAGAQTYCVPVSPFANYWIDEFITTGGVSNVNNLSGAGVTSIGYSNYTTTQTVAGVQGNTISFTASGSTTSTFIWRVYVDWNQDGDFIDLGEDVFTNGNTYANAVSGTFTIPLTAVAGPTRLRVYNDFLTSGTPPCGFSTSGGEAEDYTFNVISLTPCTGTPTAGVATASPTNPCAGNPSTINVTGSSLQSGLTYQWKSSATGAPGSYTSISGATSLGYTIPAVTAVGYYYLVITCTGSGLKDSTAPIMVTPNSPTIPYYETFNSITAINTLPNCMTATFLGTNTFTYITNQTSNNRVNHTQPAPPAGTKFASFYPNGANIPALFTPAFNLVAGRVYEFSFWYRTGNASNGPAGAEWTGLEARFGTAPTLAAMLSVNTIGAVSPQPVNNPEWRQFTETFSPNISGTYFIGIIGFHTSSTNSYLTIDDIGLNELAACTGTPTPGGAPVASAQVVCPGNTTTLMPDTTGGPAYYFSDVAYRWQDSIRGRGWQPVAVNATSAKRRYTTNPINDTTYFRLIMKCNNSGDTGVSGIVRIDPNFPPMPYVETFESITANNQFPTCMTTSSTPGVNILTYTAAQAGTGRTNRTVGGAKFASFNANAASTEAIYTPGLSLKADTTYEFSFWYQSGNTTSTTATNFTGLDARAGASPVFNTMTTLGVVRPGPISNNGYQQFTTTFRPTTSGVYYFAIVVQRSILANTFLSVDDLGVRPLNECTSAPADGGTVNPPSITVCPGAITNLALNLPAASVRGNQTITWQRSFDGGLTYTNVIAPALGLGTLYLQTDQINANTTFRTGVSCATNSHADTAFSVGSAVTPAFPVLPYIETFESITAANTLPTCMTATSLGNGVLTYLSNQPSGNRINHTVGGSKFATFNLALPAATVNGIYTPGMNLVAGQTYRFDYWYTTGNGGTGGASNAASLSAWYGTSPSIAGMTIPIGSVRTALTNTGYQKFEETFIPAVSGVYYIGIQATNTSNTAGYITIDDIGLDELDNCTDTPSAGTIAAITPCANTPFTLMTTGGTSRFQVAGLTYQWQDSTVNDWQAATGTTANSSEYTTSISAPRPFRLIITCSASGRSDTSDAYYVTLQPFYNCYCIPTYATGSGASGITNVKLRDLDNTSSIAAPFYTDYTPQQPGLIAIPQLTMTVNDTVAVKMASFATNYSGVWIDFNHNSVFDTSEFFTNGVTTGANGTARIVVNPPATALFGLTRMRIRSGDRAVVTNTMACGATGSAFGEAEDYFVTIQYPPCAGPVNAGQALSSDASTCPGYSIDLTDTTHEKRMSGISWNWQSSIDGGLSWVPVAGSAGKDTLRNVLVTRAVSYRLRMFCANTGDSSYSTPAVITIKPPYACYCVSQSTGTGQDISDIGAVRISDMVNSTGGPHILNPEAVRRHTFFTEMGNVVMSANGRYRLSIYHIQRNAVHENARVSVFLDYNNDLQYNAPGQPATERVFTQVTTAGYFYIDTMISIPNAVIPDAPTGMRVILNADLDPNAPANLGCGEYLSGETEDYVVKFTRVPQGIGTVSGNVETMSLYPNPTTGRFTVTATGAKALGSVEVNVSTITGQRILSTTSKDAGLRYTTELDLSAVARGIYFVELKTQDGEKITRKLSVR